jgi:hypothetical protein
MDVDVEMAYATMLLCSFIESSSHCVCITKYCMQETTVQGKGAIKFFVLGLFVLVSTVQGLPWAVDNYSADQEIPYGYGS